MASLKTAKQINTNTNTPSISTLVNNHNYSTKNKIKKYSDSSNFIIYHQNIRGISKKTEELLTFWRQNYFFNFSTLCIQNVNNTGTKQVRIMKQTAF